MLLSYATVDFHEFYYGAANIQIGTLLTRSQCGVSDTQVTVKALLFPNPFIVVKFHNLVDNFQDNVLFFCKVCLSIQTLH